MFTTIALMAQILLLGVNHDNYQTKVKADNVIFIPEIFTTVWEDERPYQIWRGSRFSAKSWTKALQLLLKPEKQSYFRAIFARNTQKSARDSQFQLFKDMLKKYPILAKRWEISESKMQITHYQTGFFIKGGSFEDSDALLSVPELTDFWAEEPISRTGSIQRTDFENIVGTLRNSEGIQPQFHFTFNPIGKDNFIYEDFYDKDKKKYDGSEFADLLVNYDSNPFCPENRIKFLDSLARTNPRRYEVDGLGHWGEPSNDSPFLTNYDDGIHYNKDIDFKYGQYETWLSFDFNHTPTTCNVYQLIPHIGVIGVRSYVQNGGTRKLCQLMKHDKELMKVNKLLWTLTGDSSGKSYTSTGGDVNDYDIILEEFDIAPSQLVGVHSRNKSLVYSRRLNEEFLYRVPFQMSKSMGQLRADFLKAVEDKHGNLYKNRKEGYGMDLFDAHRYFVHALCPNGLDDINYIANKFR